MAPVSEDNGSALHYPLGLSDMEQLTGSRASLERLRSVSWFLFRGAEDQNDPVDFSNCYASEDATLIRDHFGAIPAKRWLVAQRLYREAKLPGHFKLYPGLGHEVSAQIREDVALFLEGELKGPQSSELRQLMDTPKTQSKDK